MNDIRENILNNIHKHNQKYIEKKTDLSYDDFMRYVIYITENIIEMGLLVVIN